MALADRDALERESAADGTVGSPTKRKDDQAMADLNTAQDALLQAIEDAAKNPGQFPPAVRGAAIRDLAYAYRAVKGGHQPGGVFVDAK